jgi:UDPglucose 6-dehydrogenase
VRPSSVCVVGAGHVGLVTAACLAELGHRVTCVDTDEDRIEALRSGTVPIHEPGLDTLIERHRASGALRFTASYKEALEGVDFVFVAVNTPSTPEGAADLRHVRRAARQIGRALKDSRPIIVNKSTVPVGTAETVDHILRQEAGGLGELPVVSNPEFLREGTAIEDFMKPDRVVLGSNDREAARRVAELYGPLKAPVLITDPETAEMVKYASNAFLATKISFINEIASICEGVGADVSQVAQGMGLDKRIGSQFLQAGIGYGGSCLPKDVKALVHMASIYGSHPQLLNAVLQINVDQRRRLVRRLRETLGSLEGATVAVLGLAYKPNTDDVRDSPAIDIIRLLDREGAAVRAHDPVANQNLAEILPDVTCCSDAYEAVSGCDAVIIATDWPQFLDLDLRQVKARMRRPVLVDGRNLFHPDVVRGHGFTYLSIGRPDHREEPLVSEPQPKEA